MMFSSWMEGARWAVVTVVALALPVVSVVAQAGDSEFNVRVDRHPAETKILAELNKPTDLVFIDAPLSAVILYLKERHGFEILPDQIALDDAGVGTDQPVTIELEGISLRAALRILLRNLQLTYTVQDEVLLITTHDQQPKRLITQVYEVGDLVRRGSADQLAEALRAMRGDVSQDAKILAYDTLLLVRDTDQAHQAMSELLHIMRAHLNKTSD